MQDINESLTNLETIVLRLISKTGADLSDLKTEIEDLKETVKRPVFDQIDNYIKERMKQIEEMKKSEGKGDC